MAKQGMKRQHTPNPHPKNEVPPVPEIQGSAKMTKHPANPIIAGTGSPSLKVYHSKPYRETHGLSDAEKPIPADIYPAIDTDLARDNIENDIPAADLNDL